MAPSDLAAELLARLQRGERCDPAVAGALMMAIDRHVDDHQNHFGARHLIDLFHRFHGFAADIGPLDTEMRTPVGYGRWRRFRMRPTDVEDATVVNLGCGTRNPLGYLMVLVLLGARRCIGIDLEMPADLSLAARGIARAAALMLLDPRIVVGDYPVSRGDIAARAEGFDLQKLFWGDAAGVDESRLSFWPKSVEATGLADGEADLVVSNSLLEHLPDLDAALVELARITRRGGINAHYVDGADHRSYRDPALGPLAFLEEGAAEGLVHGSNRVRPLEYLPLFERHGFELVHVRRWPGVEVTDALRARLAEPWRSMPADTLAHTQLRLVVRRR